MNKCDGRTEYTQPKSKVEPFLTLHIIMNSKWIIGLNEKVKIAKILEKISSKYL